MEEAFDAEWVDWEHSIGSTKVSVGPAMHAYRYGIPARVSLTAFVASHAAPPSSHRAAQR